MADTDDQPDDVDFPEIVAQKMVAEQRQQIWRQRAQTAPQTEITGDNFELHEAALIFNHLRKRIEQFEAELGENEEIGLQLANFGLAAQLHIRAISYQNPSLIEFHGLDPKGNKVTLIQHIDQLNFMLVAVRPIKQEPYRIGFLEDIDENPET